MNYQQWQIAPADEIGAERLTDAGYPWLASAVLAARGITTPTQADRFLSCAYSLCHPPLLLRDMDKAAARIEAALAAGERMAVFGDYDVDGITATCLLTDYLRSRGADCLYYIPRRIEEGYGLGGESLRALAGQGVTLLITVDCGITGVEETELARSLGMDLVITDHHACKEVLPAAEAVVDPHRPDCPYPFKALAGVGVALKLVLALGGPEQEQALFARYCTLAAIGTVADVMAMTDENRTIVHQGLAAGSYDRWVGLDALLRECGLEGKPLTSVQVGFVLSPRINAAGRMGEADVAAQLLLTDDRTQAEELSRALCALNRERQSVEQEIFAQAVEQIEALAPAHRSALVLADARWHQGVVGIVASRLTEKYGCPCFMIHMDEGGSGKGSCRSYGGFNLFGALEACSDLLEGYGGHELAAGFTIRMEQLSAFRQRMNDYVRTHTGGEPPMSVLTIDAVVPHPQQLTLQEVEALALLEPYGTGNMRPVFCIRGATLESLQPVGQNRHLKLRLSKGACPLDAIFFSATAADCGVSRGQRVDVAFYAQINEFRGNRSVQLQIIDLRPARAPSGREEEALRLCSACVQGETVSAKEAARLLPSREQFVGLWRQLQAVVPADGLREYALPLLRQLAGELPGAEPFLRTALCLRVFHERGLLELRQEGESLCLQLTDAGKKVELEQCPYVKSLRTILNQAG